MQKDYKIHADVVRLIYQTERDDLWDISPEKLSQEYYDSADYNKVIYRQRKEYYNQRLKTILLDADCLLKNATVVMMKIGRAHV